ncbi:TetR/AcrR family transcriptional regulator [Pseudonocardia sp. NPDC049154]|uniref:TetR/AcrR family transcriptional regulator n=1 Tax=Pseudonocardia sp. NPDC049154 TaxID=3155501 RepID=UPI0033C72D83
MAKPLAERRALMAARLAPAVLDLLGSGLRYRDLSVEQIANAAGMARSTFYAHFDDKSHLLALLARDVVDEVVAAGTDWTDLRGDATEADMRAAFAAILDTYRRHRVMMEALTEESSHDRRVRSEFERMYTLARQLIAEHVAEGQVRGTVDPWIDAEPTVAWLVAMLDRGLYLHARRGELTDERSVSALAAVVWRTLYAGAPRRAPARN